MSKETLLSAARRVVRFFNIDQQHGGRVSIETIHAVTTLDIQVEREAEREKEQQVDVIRAVAPRS